MFAQFKSVFSINRISAATATLTAIAGLMAGDAVAVSIRSTVRNDPNTELTFGLNLQDGDFRIIPNTPDGSASWLGDGFDDVLLWDFDFKGASKLDAFKNAVDSGYPILSALASFTITPTNGLVSTDATGITFGRAADGVIYVNRLSHLLPEIGETGTLQVNLLDWGFTSEKILSAFNSGTPNSIPWFWQDDVQISSATLKLEVASPSSVPEPNTLLGILAVGSLGWLLKRCNVGKRAT